MMRPRSINIFLLDGDPDGIRVAQISAVSVAQRFSSDLKLNLHWHILLADGVWQERDGQVQFYPAEPLDTIRVQETLHDAVLRVTKALTRRGWQDREDDPFAEEEPGLSALWRAALLGNPKLIENAPSWEATVRQAYKAPIKTSATHVAALYLRRHSSTGRATDL